MGELSKVRQFYNWQYTHYPDLRLSTSQRRYIELVCNEDMTFVEHLYKEYIDEASKTERYSMNTPAWRGVVLQDGSIWAWPTYLLQHSEAFDKYEELHNYRARWRQWYPNGPVDFDAGTSTEDKERVRKWIKAANYAG